MSLGRAMQQLGFAVGEHPAFGGVCSNGCHVENSYHYRNGALDVNADNMAGGEAAALDDLAAVLNALGWHVLWRVENHYDHIHVDVANTGGGIGGGGAGDVGYAVRLVDYEDDD